MVIPRSLPRLGILIKWATDTDYIWLVRAVIDMGKLRTYIKQSVWL
jgi:hypothetical protein